MVFPDPGIPDPGPPRIPGFPGVPDSGVPGPVRDRVRDPRENVVPLLAHPGKRDFSGSGTRVPEFPRGRGDSGK